MENVEKIMEKPPKVKQAREILLEPSTSVVQVPKQVPEITKEQTVMNVEKLSDLKYVGNFNNCAQTVMQDFVRCKVKSEAKAASLDIKWREESKRDALIQRKIAERRLNVDNIKAHGDLREVQRHMLMEEFQTSSKLIHVHNTDLEKAVISLNNAKATKELQDETIMKILKEKVTIKQEHCEKVRRFMNQLSKYKEVVKKSSRKHQEMLEQRRNVLEVGKRRYEEAKRKLEQLKADVESKKEKLKQVEDEQSRCDTKITELLQSKDDLIKNRESLKETHDLLLKETKTDALKETIKTYQATETKYQEAVKTLEESKSKNTVLSEGIKTSIDKFDFEKLERQFVLSKYTEEIEKMKKHAEELRNQINKTQAENLNILKDIERQRKTSVEVEAEYASKKLMYDKLNGKREVERALLGFAQNEFEVYNERAEKVIAEKEELRGFFESLWEVYQNSVERSKLLDNAKQELETEMDTSNKILEEKSVFYAASKKVMFSVLESLMREQESMVQKEEKVLHEMQFKLEKQDALVNSLNEQAAIKKERADMLYNAFTKLEMEIKEKKTEAMTTNPSAPSASRVTDVITNTQPVQRGILKSPERQKGNTKKVTFDPTLNDGLGSEGSVERMFEEFFGNQKIKEEKRLSSEELFDNLLRTSPPEKEQK